MFERGLRARGIALAAAASIALAAAVPAWAATPGGGGAQRVVGTYEELISAVQEQSPEIVVDGEILVEGTVTVTHDCTIVGRDGASLVRSGEFTDDAILSVGDDSWGWDGPPNTLTIKGITIDGGMVAADEAAVVVNEGCSLIGESSVVKNNITEYGNGGGIKGVGGYGDAPVTVELRDCAVQNNSAGSGGGIYVMQGEVRLLGSTFVAGNSAEYDGGGIQMEFCDEDAEGLVMLGESKVDDNAAGGDGAGVHLREGRLRMSDSAEISRNAAAGDGGGVYADSYGMVQGGGSIHDNKAGGSGGGVMAYQGACELVVGSCYDNTAAVAGDDVYNDSGLETLYATQAPRALGDGDSSELGTVLAQPIPGYGNRPQGDVSVPFHGWFMDGDKESWRDEEFENLYTDFENGLMISEENGNAGFLSGENDYAGAKAIWYGLLLAYDANCEGGGYRYDGAAYSPGSSATAEGGIFDRPGYEFAGWNTEPDGSGTAYLPGDAVPMGESTVLYAQWRGTLSVVPADLTVYKGGDDGYDGTVGEDGRPSGSSSLPVPFFHISLPDGSSPAGEVVFESGGKRWTATRLESTDGKAYYAMEAGPGQDPVRVIYTGADGEAHLSDDFDITAVKDLYAEFSCELYHGDVDPDSVTATAGGETYGVDSSGAGTLTVRTVEQASGPTSPIVNVPPSSRVPSGSGMVVAPAGTRYFINDTGIEVPSDLAAPSLLFDTIVSHDGVDRESALEDRAGEAAGPVAPGATRCFQSRYLDLVDANDGNAWIKASGNVTVLWGYPEGTGPETDFELYHFPGLHRDGDDSGYVLDQIEGSAMESIDIEKTDAGIAFEVGPGGFSPFVLTWESSSQDVPGDGGGAQGGPEAPDGTAGGLPQTGDAAPLAVAALALAGSLAAASAAVLARRRG